MTNAADIIIADDDEDFLCLLRYMLLRAGFGVRMARNGHEVLKAVQEQIPDLIVMDWWMPGMDGLTCTRELKEELGFQDIIILAVTAQNMRGDRNRVIAAGCDAFYSKPISSTYLVDEVKRHLEKRTRK